MTFLAIDSSQNYGSVALQRDGVLVYDTYFHISVTHSETLMPQIDHALKFCQVSKSDLSAVFLCHGPGSFTGLRIGMATAKGIAYGLKIPVITFNSLETTAVNLYGCGSDVLCVMDARMKEIYLALYDQHLNEIIPPLVCKPDNLPPFPKKGLILTGSATAIISPLLANQGIDHQRTLPNQRRMTAASLFTLQSLKPQNMDFDLTTLAEMEPLYLRESTAQILGKVQRRDQEND